MRNKLIILLQLILAMCLILTVRTTCAAQTIDDSEESLYTIEIEDSALENATLISSVESIEGDRRITVKTYKDGDGTIIIDTLNVYAYPLRSPNGSDTAIRTRTISGWASITIIANFDWYTEGYFSYVRCSSMSTGRTLQPGVVVDTWNTSRTENYVSIGSAKAEVEYFFHHDNVPYQYKEGTFRITCTDSGTISDNG